MPCNGWPRGVWGGEDLLESNPPPHMQEIKIPLSRIAEGDLLELGQNRERKEVVCSIKAQINCEKRLADQNNQIGS